MKIIVNVPSIYPDRFSKFIESFNAMQSIRKYFMVHQISVYEDYNADYWTKQIIHAIQNMCMLRTRSLSYESDYIMFCDDDLIFKPEAEQYIKKIIDILENEKPDVLNIFGSRYKNEFIHNPETCIIGTNRGLFVKTEKLRDANWLNKTTELQGGLEESVIAYKALENNGKLIVIGDAPIERHYKHTPSAHNVSSIHDTLIWQYNAQKFIRQRYSDPTWTHDSGKFPIGLNYNMKPKELEKQIGGNHYSKLAIQPIEYCYRNNIPAIESGVIKYVTRHKDKGGKQDIEKAIHLLEILLELEYGDNNEPRT